MKTKNIKISAFYGLIVQDVLFRNMTSAIHGVAHAERVWLLANLLANFYADSKPDLTIVTLCALLHDCGRREDGRDELHGARSAELAMRFIERHQLNMNAKLVETIILHHCPPPDYEETGVIPLETKIVGDADKLDRFRLFGDNPCDPAYLELPESQSLMGLAARLNGWEWEDK